MYIHLHFLHSDESKFNNGDDLIQKLNAIYRMYMRKNGLSYASFIYRADLGSL